MWCQKADTFWFVRLFVYLVFCFVYALLSVLLVRCRLVCERAPRQHVRSFTCFFVCLLAFFTVALFMFVYFFVLFVAGLYTKNFLNGDVSKCDQFGA